MLPTTARAASTTSTMAKGTKGPSTVAVAAALLLALLALLPLAAAAPADHHDDGVPGVGAPLCERPDCSCTEDAEDLAAPSEARGVRVDCDFGRTAAAAAGASSTASSNAQACTIASV